MEKKIIEFVGLLRKNGVKVSLSETLDAFAAVGHVSLENRRVLKDALRASLVKDVLDVPAFDELFNLYFSGLKGIFEKESLLSDLFPSGAIPHALMEKLARTLDDVSGGFSPLTRYLLSGDHVLMEKLLKEMSSQLHMERMNNHLQIGFYAQTLFSRMPWENVREDMERLEERLREKGLRPEDIQTIRQEINRRKEALREALREFVGKEFRKMNFGYFERSKDHWLSERSFSSLSEAEIQRMKEVVRRLAQRLKNVAAIRRKTAKRGTLDIKKTLRKSLTYDGIPFGLTMKRRREEKPRIVLLCDISDSVRTVSRFMLQFVYAMQELFSRVRSFVFVSDIGEVTQLFRDQDIDGAIERAYCGGVVSVYSHSNYGHTLREFHRKFLGVVNRRTTVIIMGDARNNYNDPSSWALGEIRERAREVIWLNPEHESAWGFGDSVMDIYHSFCDVVEEVNNLSQLSRVIDRLVGARRSLRHHDHPLPVSSRRERGG